MTWVWRVQWITPSFIYRQGWWLATLLHGLQKSEHQACQAKVHNSTNWRVLRLSGERTNILGVRRYFRLLTILGWNLEQVQSKIHIASWTVDITVHVTGSEEGTYCVSTSGVHYIVGSIIAVWLAYLKVPSPYINLLWSIQIIQIQYWLRCQERAYHWNQRNASSSRTTSTILITKSASHTHNFPNSDVCNTQNTFCHQCV